MSFFRSKNTKLPAIQVYAQNVETILTALGVDVNVSRMNTDGGFAWGFQRGSAAIEVYVSERDGVGYLQVLSPMMHLPQTGLLPLYRRLLENNLQMTNASLGVYLDVVYVFCERPLNGLDEHEANYIIAQVAEYADSLDNQLVKEFGGRLYARV